MYDIASSILQQKLAQVSGVGQVVVGGGALPGGARRVQPDGPLRNGLALEDVRAVLASANANRPEGELAAPSAAWSLATTDQLPRASSTSRLVITTERRRASASPTSRR
jgi:multidrug efflux pump